MATPMNSSIRFKVPSHLNLSSYKANKKAKSSYEIVVAIDFGTSHSGYAYSRIGAKDTIILNKPWKSQSTLKSYKAPTCILADNDGKCVSFGYDAQRKACDPKPEERNFKFFNNFKMQLFDKESDNGNSTKRKPSLPVFAAALKYLKDHFHEAYKRTHGCEAENIRWVLTVPAIWSEVSKAFMRKAADEAELTTRETSNQLVIALEPEAASIFCRQMATKFIETRGEHHFGVADAIPSSPTAEVNLGSRYMIVDCGGGTVDICVHEILSNTEVKEVNQPSGGPWGGAKINENFVHLFKQIVDFNGSEFVTKYSDEHKDDWLKLQLDFEAYKCNFSLKDPMDFKYRISRSFERRFTKLTGSILEDVIATTSNLGAKMDNDGDDLQIEHAVIKDKCFKPVIDNIIKHVAGILNTVTGITHIFMVGGLSQCEMLQEEMISQFGNPYEIRIPEEEAGVAVLKGAVHFGHNQSIISRRIARKTYGVRVSHVFDHYKHKHHKKEIWEGATYCKDIFDVIIRKNNEVKFGEFKRIEYLPLQSEQTEATLEIYEVDREEVMYTDEAGVIRVGTLGVPMHDTRGGKDRDIELSVQLGTTELTFQAKQFSSNGFNAVRELKIRLE